MRVVPRTLARVAEYPSGSTYGPHRLPEHEFVWVLQGSARWQVEDSGSRHEVELVPGMLALARAGTVNHFAWDVRRTSTHAYLHFSVDGSGLPGEDRWPVIRTMEGQDPLRGICSYLLDLAADGGERGQRRSDQMAGVLFDLFVNGPFPGPHERLRVPDLLLLPLEHVRRSWLTNGMRLVNVGELADLAGVSAAHFSREFRREVGTSPAAALELIRLARAAITLQRSNLTLTEVARMSGFSNPYHFSRRFSAIYHQPPGRYRHSQDADDPLSPLTGADLLGLWHFLSTPVDGT